MANRFAIANGDFGSTATWSTTAGGAGGASVPIAGDNAIANNRTVTITANVTCDNLYNDTTGSATAGGGFACSTAGVTITATIQRAHTADLLTISNASGTVTVVGDVYGRQSGTAAISSVIFSGLGTLDIVGNIYGPNNVPAGKTITVSAAGTCNITGNVTNTSSGVQAVVAITVTAAATVNIVGNIDGATLATSSGYTVSISAAATVNVTGSVTGYVSHAIFATAGNIYVTGTVTASATMSGIGITGTTATLYASGPFIVGSNGVNALFVPKWLWLSAAGATYMQVRTESTLVVRSLYTADSVGGNPAEADVREGTVYGPASELEGTLAVPAAASVGFGVPVDNTTGTASLTAADIRAALGMASANLDTQLSAIDTVVDSILLDTAEIGAAGAGLTALASAANLTTVDTVVDALKVKTDQLTFTVAGQVDSNALTGGLDAAGVRSAVGLASANLDTQLGAIDTVVDAVKVKTDNLPTDPADQSAVESAITAATSGLATASALATVDGIVDAILVDTDTTIPALINAVPTAAETWAHVIESGFTAAQVMRILSAVAAGSASGLENGSPSFTGLDGATTRVAGTYATGTRTVTTVDGT